MSQARKTRSTRSSKSVDTNPVAEIITTSRVKKPVADKVSDPLPSKKVKKEKSTSVSKDLNTNEDEPKKSVAKKSEKANESMLVKPVATSDVKDEEMKKITMVGTVPVDPQFSSKTSSSKVAQKNGIVYASTLNQSNIGNNNNKFYILQIVENGPSDFVFFCRWGRVGVVGQSSEMRASSLQMVIPSYQTKLRQKVRGGYTVVEMNYEADAQDEKKDEEADKIVKPKEPEVESQLSKEVQDLIRLIFDMKMMNNQMKEIGYDAKKMPLGKLSKTSIEKGYEALKNLMEQAKSKHRRDVFVQYSNQFYSNIPHDIGFSKMQNYILDTEQKIKAKLQMLQSLQDIQIYTKILNEGKISSDMNELDSNYLRLNTDIKAIDKSSEVFKKLQKYVINTHATTHNNYKLEIQEIYRLDKGQENKKFTQHIHNKQLLWHGSRLTNFVGILSQGLRIAPPEAPVTGYMFGKGVYFADMVSKSANYCCTSSTNNTGLMLLCEVALGDCWQKFAADYYASNLPMGKHSTKGVGRTAPQSGEQIEGTFAPNDVGQAVNVAYTSLLYNEFIVYDINQIKFKYLFKLKFNYRR